MNIPHRNPHLPRPSFTTPTPPILSLLQLVHLAGGRVEAVPAQRHTFLRQAVERGWLAETDEHVELTESGRKHVEGSEGGQ